MKRKEKRRERRGKKVCSLHFWNVCILVNDSALCVLSDARHADTRSVVWYQRRETSPVPRRSESQPRLRVTVVSRRHNILISPMSIRFCPRRQTWIIYEAIDRPTLPGCTPCAWWRIRWARHIRNRDNAIAFLSTENLNYMNLWWNRITETERHSNTIQV